MTTALIARVSFTIAATDAGIAAICAACGDAYCITFMVLAGLMLAHGLYYKTKAEKEGE